MDERAAKRIRTSPPEQRDRGSSPLKLPPRRRSSASPTKASLARHYPSLVPQPRSDSSTTRPGSHGSLFSRGKQALSYILGRNGEDSARQAPVVPQSTQLEELDASAAAAEQFSNDKPKHTTPRGRRTIASRPNVFDGTNEDEEELPTTPSSRALQKRDTPRRGILYSSPSKRPPRLKDGGRRSSLMLEPSRARSQEPKAQGEVAVDKDQTALGEVQKPKTRFDPELEKKKHERDTLLQQQRALEDDVSLCLDEIQSDQTRSTSEKHQLAEQDKIISLVNELGKSDVPGEEEAAPTVSTLLCSFLPFTTRPMLPPVPKRTQEKPIPSHQPLQLEDPLPYLQMFTSFNFDTRLSLPVDYDVSKSPPHQVHTIDISGPQKLLTSTIVATIEASKGKIVDLRILRLPYWTEHELGKFIRTKAEERDLSNMCWAIGSYWELAKKRAEHWHKCELRFGHLIPGRTSEDTENVRAVTDKRPQQLTRKDLHRHLGRDVLVLENKHVLLKLKWRIGFEWTGDAESEIGVEPALPAVWSEADNQNSLKKIPTTFDTLLRSKGAFEATRIMVALLFTDN